MRLAVRAADGPAAGHPGGTGTPDGSGQSKSHVPPAIPAVFVVVVVIVTSLLARYLIVRLRMSGRRVLSFLTDSSSKPKLSDVVLDGAASQHAEWEMISPVAAEFLSGTDRQRWERAHRSASPAVWRFRGREEIPLRRRGEFSSAGRGDVGMTVIVFIAMPAPGQQQRRSRSPEFCLGTVDVNVSS